MIAIQKRSRIKVDAAMALTLTSFLALGVILITKLETNQINLDQILFGDILGVTSGDVWRTAIITGIILVLTKLFYKELEFYTFDPLGAKSCWFTGKLALFRLDLRDYLNHCCQYANCRRTIGHVFTSWSSNYRISIGKRTIANDAVRLYYWSDI